MQNNQNSLREEFKKFNGDQIGDDIIADYWLAKLEEAKKEAVEGVLEKMMPYTITGNPDMYCATFTIEQFRQILKQNK